MNKPKPSPDKLGMWKRIIHWSNGDSEDIYKVEASAEGLRWWNKNLNDWMYAHWFEEIPSIEWYRIERVK